MPVLAGWLTGEQVPLELIEQTLTAMGDVLARHGGQPTCTVLPGAGLIAFSDMAYTMQNNDDPPVLDWVPDRRTLLYRRPLSGLHTLYFVTDWPAQGNLLFASEIKALLAAGAPRRLHLAALDSLARYGFIPAPWTVFKGISVVPAGSLLRWQRAKLIVNSATDYHLAEPFARHGTLDQLDSLLNTKIKHLLPPHEALVALTGGSDASALATLIATQQTSIPFTVASINYTKSSSPGLWAAERLATTCQRPFLEITAVDQPEFWIPMLVALEAPCVDTRSLTLHQLLHTTTVETGARVAISGLGASILLPGTATHDPFTNTGDTQTILHRYSQTLPAHPQLQLAPFWSQDVAHQLQQEEPWKETLHARKLARQAGKLINAGLAKYYLDLHLRFPDAIVHPMQQLAIHENMVVRSPYLNGRLLDMLARLPAVLEDGTAKASLLSALVKRYMSDRGVAQETLSLHGPVTSLRNSANSDLLRQTLSQEAIRAKGIFDPLAVEKMLKSEKEDMTPSLLLVFTTQLLCQLFGIEI